MTHETFVYNPNRVVVQTIGRKGLSKEELNVVKAGWIRRGFAVVEPTDAEVIDNLVAYKELRLSGFRTLMGGIKSRILLPEFGHRQHLGLETRAGGGQMKTRDAQ